MSSFSNFVVRMEVSEAYIERLRGGASLATALPLTLQILASAVGERRIRLACKRSLTLLLWNDILRLILKRVGHRDELRTRLTCLAGKAKDSRAKNEIEILDQRSLAITYHHKLQPELRATNGG